MTYVIEIDTKNTDIINKLKSENIRNWDKSKLIPLKLTLSKVFIL